MRKLAVIGASWGGAAAVTELLGQLNPSCQASLVVALHRAPSTSDNVLLASLQRTSALPVEEAEDKTPLSPGRASSA